MCRRRDAAGFIGAPPARFAGRIRLPAAAVQRPARPRTATKS
ncbi:hypothetical protein ACIBCN_10695 [Nocardia sp. NPDC051052]